MASRGSEVAEVVVEDPVCVEELLCAGCDLEASGEDGCGSCDAETVGRPILRDLN